MGKDQIIIKGAREHNLKNIDLTIPRDKFIVFTGLSGSGKSSLAFDTIYAEGQRRYVESLSSYARQFLGQMEKPEVDSIEGLSPAISIDQKTTNRNPRSTVGTVTEIYDYFRLLYARVGIPHCPECGKEIKKQTIDQIVDAIMMLEEMSKIQLLAPVVRGRKGQHIKLLEDAKKSGYVRAVIDGNMYELTEEILLDKNKKHTIEIVVDRLVIKDGIMRRLSDSIETVMKLTGGILNVDVIGQDKITFSQNFSCVDCNISIDEIEPRLFSFNNPFGACEACHGLGYELEFDPDLIVVDKKKSVSEGAIKAPGWNAAGDKKSYANAMFKALAKKFDFSLDEPYEQLSQEAQDILMYGRRDTVVTVNYSSDRGSGEYEMRFEGVINSLMRRYKETSSEYMRQEYESLMTNNSCSKCKGERLKPEALAVTIGEKSIAEVTNMAIIDIKTYLDQLALTDRQAMIGELVLKEIVARINFLVDVGLDYLSL